MAISSEPTDLRDKKLILWRLRKEKLLWGRRSTRRGEKWIIQDEVAYFAGNTRAGNVYVDIPTLYEMHKDRLIDLKTNIHICGDDWAEYGGEVSRAEGRRSKSPSHAAGAA